MPNLLQTRGKVWIHICTESFVGTRSGITKPEVDFLAVIPHLLPLNTL